MTILYYAVFKAPEDKTTRERLLKILSEISKRDETFVWGVSKNKKYITIVSESESQAHQRVYWIKNKADISEEYRKKLVYRIFKVEINKERR